MAPCFPDRCGFPAENYQPGQRPGCLKPFWEQFDALKDYSRQQQIEPVLNKLRQFTLRPGLRNVLGQAKPKFSLTDLFYQRKIVLVSLNKGLVGGECSRCLGSLIVGLDLDTGLVPRQAAAGESGTSYRSTSMSCRTTCPCPPTYPTPLHRRGGWGWGSPSPTNTGISCPSPSAPGLTPTP